MIVEKVEITTGAAIKRGERILVEMIMVDRCMADKFADKFIAARFVNSTGIISIGVENIFAVLPRVIEKDDVVSMCDETGRHKYKVLHIEEGFAFLRTPSVLSDDQTPCYRLSPVDDLELIS